MPPLPKGFKARVKDLPPKLKGFAFHGVDLVYQDGAEQAHGDCPMCGSDGRFYVSAETGMWDCKSCHKRGNLYTFLRHVYEMSAQSTTTPDYGELLKTRRLLSANTLSAWGVVKSALTGDWLVAGYGVDGKLNQLYKYAPAPDNRDKLILHVTPGTNHQIHGLEQWDPKKQHVHICEGPWDGMAWWEVLRETKLSDSGLTHTENEAASLLANTNVIAVPGCNVFPPAWSELCAGKTVTFLYDSDHPRVNKETGITSPAAGWDGTRKACLNLLVAEQQPQIIQTVVWGEGGYDPKLPTGYDVRDALTAAGPTVAQRIPAVQRLMEKVQPIPADWIGQRTEAAKASGGVELELLECETWKDLRTSWIKTMKWHEGLDSSFLVMLACVTSTMVPDSQLWCKIIGPPSSGKTTLIEAIGVNKKYTLSRSTIRGFHSGYKAEDGEDVSLAAQVCGRTLLTKDGDTLLQAPNLGQILAEARDIYDGAFRTHYRNGKQTFNENVRMTWIICGTESIREIDASELGERFLDCVVMDGIADDFEDEVLWKVINRADRNISMGSIESLTDPDRVKAMQLTGGYVRYLRENAIDLLAQVVADEDTLRQIMKLGKFVAFMRARPRTDDAESATREFGARLVEQHLRLAKCLAVVLNKHTVDAEVMRVVKKVSMDTSRGLVLDISKHLFKHGTDGCSHKYLAKVINQKDVRTESLLRFMRAIGAVEFYMGKQGTNMHGQPRWRLTTRLMNLYRAVGAPLV